GGVAQAALDELEAHQPIVHTRECGTGKLDHVDLDALARQVVDQRRCQITGPRVLKYGGVEQVHAENPHRLLLMRGVAIEKMGVNDDLRRLLVRVRLESNAEPPAAVLSAQGGLKT